MLDWIAFAWLGYNYGSDALRKDGMGWDGVALDGMGWDCIRQGGAGRGGRLPHSDTPVHGARGRRTAQVNSTHRLGRGAHSDAQCLALLASHRN